MVNLSILNIDKFLMKNFLFKTRFSKMYLRAYLYGGNTSLTYLTIIFLKIKQSICIIDDIHKILRNKKIGFKTKQQTYHDKVKKISNLNIQRKMLSYFLN